MISLAMLTMGAVPLAVAAALVAVVGLLAVFAWVLR